MKKPYSSETGSDAKYYVNGPGQGCGFHSGLLWPELRTESEPENEVRVKFANIGYQAGYNKAQFDIKKALGID